MTAGSACIDIADRKTIQGWVTSNKKRDFGLYINDKLITRITNFIKRQDVIDAGITSEDCGFVVDVVEHMANFEGVAKVEVRNGTVVLAAKEVIFEKVVNYIVNPWLSLENFNSIQNWQINASHRIGVSLNSFLSPSQLRFSSDCYTRIVMGDVHDTGEKCQLVPLLEPIQQIESYLTVALVAKASNDTNVTIMARNMTDDSFIVCDTVTIRKDWQHIAVELPADAVASMKAGNCELVLELVHHGRRHVDIAMMTLASDPNFLPEQPSIKTGHSTHWQSKSLLKNGSFETWSNGIMFKHLHRGQELADNWFVEFKKTNLGKFAVAAVTDNSQTDPLKESLDQKFGLRVRTRELDGYARVVCPFEKAYLNCNDYYLSLDIEALGLARRAVLPRIYIIARDATSDRVVADLARKQTVLGRERIEILLKASTVEQILANSGELPTLCLAFDFSDEQDFCLYEAELSTARRLPEEQFKQEKNNTESCQFEDHSIIEQLRILKGIDSWSSDEPVMPVRQSIAMHHTNIGQEEQDVLSFAAQVRRLKPHKMYRPSRDFPTVDIIVPVYNACDDVFLCLSSLIEKTDLLHRVIIINDGDDPRTAEMLAAFDCAFGHVQLVTNSENIGYTRSVNKGIKHSRADWVVVLNSDTVVSQTWLSKLMNCALSSDNVGMVGALSNAASWQSVPEIHDASGDWHLNPLPKNMTVDDMAELVESLSNRDYPQVGVINGFCQLINTRMLDTIGLLDEVAFPLGYGEENDMCARAVKAGYSLLIADDTYVFHAKSKSFGHEKRKVLAKQGGIELKKKHPDVDWQKITKAIFENEALVTLRNKLSKALNEQ
ncbi:glycosyltransferase family 2 protein [Alteromonas sp. CYL-A6]|uniref:glycosyltransferase family 2 protein n=1 Tax=Alteromonas nitratireducens TaxID=3390813 RepID=UPI0034AD8F36